MTTRTEERCCLAQVEAVQRGRLFGVGGCVRWEKVGHLSKHMEYQEASKWRCLKTVSSDHCSSSLTVSSHSPFGGDSGEDCGYHNEEVVPH